MKNYPIKRKQNGLTLIEILVAMVIGLFLLAGVMQIFLGSQRSYRLQENLSRMQENGRFAMDFITRDIRMAGSMGCVETADVESLLVTYPTSDPMAIFNDFTKGISDDVFPLGDTFDPNTDQITIKSMLPSDIFLKPLGTLTPEQVIESQKKGSNLLVNANTILNKNDIVMVTNCDKADIFKITDLDTQRERIAHKDDTKATFQSDYRQDAQIYTANFVTYGIKDASLYRRLNGAARKEVLVENIENMQVLYGEDTNGDHTPDYYVSADRVVDMKKVISIRISLLIVSSDNNLVSNITPYTYNGVEITPTDKRLRQVITSTIAIRKQLP